MFLESLGAVGRAVGLATVVVLRYRVFFFDISWTYLSERDLTADSQVKSNPSLRAGWVVSTLAYQLLPLWTLRLSGNTSRC